MPNIVLAKAAQVPLGGPIRWPGYSAEVDVETHAVLSARGVLAPETDTPVARNTAASSDEVKQATEAEKAPGGLPRPRQAEAKEKWEAYARSLGIDPKGLDKQEIIAATR